MEIKLHKSQRVLFQLVETEKAGPMQMGMCSTWVISSEITSNYAVKHSQRQLRTMPDLPRVAA